MAFNNFWHPVKEKCGLILKNGKVIEVENLHPHPTVGFVISEEIIEQYADEIEYLWHSHPSSVTNLSVEDYKSFLNFPQYLHRIYGFDSHTDYYVRNNIVFVREKNAS